jgi:hypothetical protein
VIDRASTFANPEIIELLKSRFITVAIDQACQRRQQDDEGEFYRQLAGQGPRNDFNDTTQGLYAGSADGKLLGFTNHRSPDRVKAMLAEALNQFRPADYVPPEPRRFDPRWNYQPPTGGLVVRVTAKVLGGYEPTDNERRKAFQEALSRDNLWATAQEHQSLVAGKFPESLAQRIARYHLVDNTRGEPPMWRESEIKSLEISIAGEKVTGTFHLETADGRRGFQGEIVGVVTIEGEQVSRLDLVARGDFWGEGPFTRGAPQGKFPFAVAFALVDGSDEADKVRPQGARGWIDGYLGRAR